MGNRAGTLKTCKKIKIKLLSLQLGGNIKIPSGILIEIFSIVSVGPRAEKFNIVNNDHGCTHKCYFSVFDQKYLLRAKLVTKRIKTVGLS